MDPTSNRERLYDIFADPGEELESKVRRGLAVGTDSLGLPIGFLTRIRDGTQEIVYAIGDHPLIQPGESCPLDEAYCRRTVQIDSALAIEHVGHSSQIPQQAIETFELGTYIGAKVIVDDESYGTICFADTAERATAFTESETYFVELFARLVGQTIERREYERELEARQVELRRRSQLIGVLNRVLRHNLRNDMSVVLGAAKTLRERLDGQDAEFAGRIVDTSTELVNISETASRLESTLEVSSETEPLDVVPVVEDVVDTVGEVYPEASIRSHHPDEAIARADSRLTIALEELVENAAKHAGDAPAVEVTVTEGRGNVRIQICDDGPGLPEQERKVLVAGEETPLVHGSGLGLWLVYWIIQGCDGTLAAEGVDTGACISIHLQASD
jgi:K+-sensing histidine kinase KdpD